MSETAQIDLALGLLDHQLVDSEGRRCGNVDDLELDDIRATPAPRVVAILVGPPVWKGRGLLGRLASHLSRAPTVRVPWEEVEKIDSAVHLKRTALELRLGRGDDRARRWIEKIPGS
jgi:sporulation protein YlmC with PRC-barrel domain